MFLLEDGVSESDKFALMLHDRLIELEARISAMVDPPLDPRVTLVGARTSKNLNTFVRVCCPDEQDLTAVVHRALETIGKRWGASLEAFAAQHYNIDGGFVFEAMVCCSTLPLSIETVAHAFLDSCDDPSSVLASRVILTEWFTESFLEISETCYRYDYARDRFIVEDAESWGHVPPTTTWKLMAGWQASVMEAVTVQHPKAPDADDMHSKLLTALEKVLEEDA